MRRQEEEYWDRRYQIEHPRPSQIIFWHLKVEGDRGNGPRESIENFSLATGIDQDRVRIIANGEMPSAAEIDAIRRGMRWSIWFLFGISREALELRATTYFSAMGVDSPSRAQFGEFKRLYEKLVYIQSRGDQE